ncbi:GNAT family N-acetyltransferase [Aurantimonas sp. VKM B-3413]|uniref:GNAT family N-acetyltransferase n=1 Tax=Aurantimonas sp. VKM B-3413 TaxID=2779401 RepID=UPI001E4B1C6E|nr:GNAT family N-acetyltransferase [Aurantimonas sp. VKM B-3413]MCB8835876.1 GNAT family N-acetyltransferase [Aurantimonas sp. VKM B-3413]
MIFAETARTRLRIWQDGDREVFHRLNSDPDVMHFFPFRRDRAASDAIMDRFNERFARDGLTFFAMEDKESGRVTGMVGAAVTEPNMPRAPGIEIGWRLLPEVWGRGFAGEAAQACLLRLFAPPFSADEVVSFCVTTNGRSEAVMRRLGMQHAGEFDHPNVDPAMHPDLVRHHLYRLAQSDWAARPG